MRSNLMPVWGFVVLIAALAAQGESGGMTGADGQRYNPTASGPSRWNVLVFVLQDCAICNGYAPEIQRIAKEYGPKGVRVFVVHVDPSLKDADAAAWAKTYGYSIPVMVDREHRLVSQFGVVAVPTVVVLDPKGQVAYMGRIDNRYFALGKSRENATTHELRDALDASVAGKPVPIPKNRVVGCAVPDLPTTRPTRGGS